MSSGVGMGDDDMDGSDRDNYEEDENEQMGK
jgi:hypothetical protein